MSLRQTAYPRARHLVVHLSDTHFVAPHAPLLHGVADSAAHLTELLAGLVSSGARPEALVFTGDLADVGDPAAYESLRKVVEPAAALLGAQVIWVMGNHDDRAMLRVELLGHDPTTAPYDHVVWLGGLRVIVIDTTVPGHHHGELAPEQLEWLATELARPAPSGTLLAMHHPPVPSVQNLAALIELRDQRALADVLRGSDVRAILAGHLHHSTFATFAGIPVSVASATCYTQDLQTPLGGTRGQDGAQSFNLVHVYDETVTHSVVPIGEYVTVGATVSPLPVSAAPPPALGRSRIHA